MKNGATLEDALALIEPGSRDRLRSNFCGALHYIFASRAGAEFEIYIGRVHSRADARSVCAGLLETGLVHKAVVCLASRGQGAGPIRLHVVHKAEGKEAGG